MKRDVQTKDDPSVLRTAIIFAGVLLFSVIYERANALATPFSDILYEILAESILAVFISAILISLLSISILFSSVHSVEIKKTFRYFLHYPSEENRDSLWIFFFLSVFSYYLYSLFFGFFSISLFGRSITVNNFDSIGMAFVSALLMWFISPITLSYILKFLNSKELDKT